MFNFSLYSKYIPPGKITGYNSSAGHGKGASQSKTWWPGTLL